MSSSRGDRASPHPDNTLSPNNQVSSSNPSATEIPVAKQVKDDFGRVVAATIPDTGTTLFIYDAADRLTASTDAMGNQITYLYDLANRVIKQTLADKYPNYQGSNQQDELQVTQWQYTGTQLSKVTHANQIEAYEYNWQGFLASKTIQLVEANKPLATITTRYTYDENGRLISMSLPDATQITYQRNGQGQVVALQRSRVQTPWLHWLAKDEVIASDIQRDIIGPSQMTTGNGYQSSRLRDQYGILGKVIHGYKRQKPVGASTAQTLALFEHAYRWDTRGNLLNSLSHVVGSTSKIYSYAYDNQDQLIVSTEENINDLSALRNVTSVADRQSTDPSSAADKTTTSADRTIHRYYYDPIGHRVLSQENINDESDFTKNVIKAGHTPLSKTPSSPRAIRPGQESRDANGNPSQSKAHQYRWNALGQLVQVISKTGNASGSDHGELKDATYRYNHRGERVAKTVIRQNDTSTQRYLYENRQMTSELNDEGAITRQYIYLADQVIAFIDYAEGKKVGMPHAIESDQATQSTIAILRSDITQLLDLWFGKTESIGYLHANHLGAIEAVTNSAGDPIWQASYAPFGAVTIKTKTSISQPSTTTFNFRLPGQYEDEETGLYYNDHRYYDPKLGRYLSPDPLGMPDGPNRYAYVRNNPLRYVDASGLILFAFDGTNNSSPPPKGDTPSNVRKFFETYNDGRKWYMNGVGRPDPDSRIGTSSLYLAYLDVRNAFSARDRTTFMFNQLDNYVKATAIPANKKISIDIIGFSRGAAMARDFANQVSASINNKAWGNKTPCVEIRFLGLWDTVAQFGANGVDNEKWQLAIPAQVKYAAHAVALNEHRYLFPSESMGADLSTPDTIKITRGFIGSHSDIGGSYGTGDLSDVALIWMHKQALNAKVQMLNLSTDFKLISDPQLHDKNTVSAAPNHLDVTGDREVCTRQNNQGYVANCTNQKLADYGPYSLRWSDTSRFIDYYATLGLDADKESKIVGKVNMRTYAQWLKQNYEIDVAY